MSLKKSRDDGCCSINLIKYIMFTYNFFFWLISIGLLGVSIWVLLSKYSYITLLSSNQFVISTGLLIAVGAAVIFVGSIGCLAIWKEDRGLLKLYIVLLITIFMCQMMSGVLAYLYQYKIKEEMSKSLNTTFMLNYNIDIKKTKAINELQSKQKCCGVFSYSDWRKSFWLSNATFTLITGSINNTVPDSCCKSVSQYCGIRDHPSNIYYDGCIEKLVAMLRENLVLIGSVGIGFCSIQILGLFFAICLFVKLKKFEGFTGLYAY